MKIKCLYSRIALTFAALILMFGGLCAGLNTLAASHHQQELVQGLSRDLAKHIAEHWPLVKAHKLDVKSLGELFHMLMVVNPSIEVYLLDNTGKIISHKAPPGRLQKEQIDLKPIADFLARNTLPIVGENPRKPDQPSIFSAADLRENGKIMGYLYIILTGDEYSRLENNAWESHVFQTVIWMGLGALGLTLLVGLWLFSLITRRVKMLSQAMAAFEQADYTGGLELATELIKSHDEIGQLATTFDHMAERIGNQIQHIKLQDEQRREMIANVSHDLRTPLTSMQGYLETLLRKNKSLTPEEHLHYLEVAVRQSRRVGMLTNELFELAKLECEGIEPNCEHFFIQELLQDVAQKFALAAKERGVEIHISPVHNIAMVYADIAMIERVLTNLLENALRHTPELGQISLELIQIKPDSVIIRVTDTGEGIAEEHLVSLFDRHSPLRQNASKKHGGAGLGLLISKRILELHGSSIEALSGPGRKGAVFSFRLPTGMVA
jgi:signal transduction histidine kinase